jgi:DNA-binding MarR family transcriptional regulator
MSKTRRKTAKTKTRTSKKADLYGVYGLAVLLAMKPKESVTSVEIDRRLGTLASSASTRSMRLRALEKAGMVKIKQSLKDPARTLHVTLTGAGDSLRQKLSALAA